MQAGDLEFNLSIQSLIFHCCLLFIVIYRVGGRADTALVYLSLDLLKVFVFLLHNTYECAFLGYFIIFLELLKHLLGVT